MPLPLAQVADVGVTVAVSDGFATDTVCVALQPPLVTLTVYVFADNPVAVCVL